MSVKSPRSRRRNHGPAGCKLMRTECHFCQSPGPGSGLTGDHVAVYGR